MPSQLSAAATLLGDLNFDGNVNAGDYLLMRRYILEYIDENSINTPSATLAWLRWHLGGETELKSMFIGEGSYFDTGIWQSQWKNW
jgi:hypothetical protein